MRIVILGGGFGRLDAALELEKRLAGDPDVAITPVNRENFMSFTPMLHEVAVNTEVGHGLRRHVRWTNTSPEPVNDLS